MKTTIKVSESEDFRQMAAIAICKELSGDVSGSYFVDPLSWEIYFREHSAPWNPWGTTKVFPLTDLSPTVVGSTDEVEDWNLALESKEFTLADIITFYKVNVGDDGCCLSSVISWARKSKKYASIIEECEDDARGHFIGFILEEFLDEVEVNLGN